MYKYERLERKLVKIFLEWSAKFSVTASAVKQKEKFKAISTYPSTYISNSGLWKVFTTLNKPKLLILKIEQQSRVCSDLLLVSKQFWDAWKSVKGLLAVL